MASLLLRAAVAPLVVLTMTGCNRTVFSPPARPMPLETAATLPPGDTGIQAEGATHSALFGPNALSGTVRVRHGVAEDLDLSVEGSALRVSHEPPNRIVSPMVHSARAGLKYRLAKHFSVAGGLGGGYSAGGAFVSPDVGPIAAWENRYLVPFVTVRGGLSQPIGPRAVDTSNEDEPAGSHFDRARSTWLLSIAAGLRVPLGWSEPEAGTTRGSLIAGTGLTHLADSRDKETFGQFAFGGEIVF